MVPGVPTDIKFEAKLTSLICRNCKCESPGSKIEQWWIKVEGRRQDAPFDAPPSTHTGKLDGHELTDLLPGEGELPHRHIYAKYALLINCADRDMRGRVQDTGAS